MKLSTAMLEVNRCLMQEARYWDNINHPSERLQRAYDLHAQELRQAARVLRREACKILRGVDTTMMDDREIPE